MWRTTTSTLLIVIVLSLLIWISGLLIGWNIFGLIRLGTIYFFVIQLEKLSPYYGLQNHRDKILFRNHTCNPVQIIPQATDTYYHTVFYNKSSNLNNLDLIAGNKAQKIDKRNNMKHSSSLLVDCLKWNTDASRIESEHSSTFSHVCRDNLRRVQQSKGETTRFSQLNSCDLRRSPDQYSEAVIQCHY